MLPLKKKNTWTVENKNVNLLMCFIRVVKYNILLLSYALLNVGVQNSYIILLLLS